MGLLAQQGDLASLEVADWAETMDATMAPSREDAKYIVSQIRIHADSNAKNPGRLAAQVPLQRVRNGETRRNSHKMAHRVRLGDHSLVENAF